MDLRGRYLATLILLSEDYDSLFFGKEVSGVCNFTPELHSHFLMFTEEENILFDPLKGFSALQTSPIKELYRVDDDTYVFTTKNNAAYELTLIPIAELARAGTK